MALMTRIQSWRKSPKPIELPKPTDDDRQRAIDALQELDGQRPMVAELQQAADKARVKRDEAKAAADEAKAAWAASQQRASSLGASLDSQARRQRNTLRRTCSPLIQEFIDTVSALLRDVRNEGVLKSAPVSGKFTMDGHAHKQPWSTFSSANDRASALVHARREAEALRFSTMDEAAIEAELQKLFDELPVVDYSKC